jgi:hypothetical protein
MTEVVTEQKKVLDQPILLRLLNKESIFQIGGLHNSYLEHASPLETFECQSKMPNAAVVEIMGQVMLLNVCLAKTKVVKFYFGHKWPNRLHLAISFQ